MTLAGGALLGGAILALSILLQLPVPEPHQRPVFFIGVVLFSVVFRLLIWVREEGKN